MADREDIDALLIGALYGELDASERARLDTHLASHHEDRLALDSMRSTRGLLRDSAVAAAMVEPPPGVSALLLQEAARRAPRAAAGGAGSGLVGFLAGLLRPITMHPAMAAAASLVIIGGAAGALYLRGASKVARPALPVATVTTEAPTAAAAGSSAPVSERGRDLSRGPSDDADDTVAATGKPDQFRVALADDDGKPAATKAAEAPAGRHAASRAGVVNDPGPGSGYLEVAPARGDQDLALLGADGLAETADEERRETRAPAPDEPQADRKEAAGEVTLRKDKVALSKPTAPGTTLPPSPAFGAPLLGKASPPVASTPLAGTTSQVAQGTAGAGPTVAALADKLDAPGAVAPYNARSDAATLSWAKDQHARMVKLVEAGNCNQAGTLGASILRRAPDYYQDRIYNDRRIRACRSYVEKARRAVDPSRKLPTANAELDQAQPVQNGQ